MIITSYSKVVPSEEDLDSIYFDKIVESPIKEGHYVYDEECTIDLIIEDPDIRHKLRHSDLVLEQGRWDAAYAKKSLEILNRINFNEDETVVADKVKYCFKLAADAGIIEIST